ncbi:ABC transporter permease [Herpetosiphon geysericola]|uniref:Peptide ABC transporter permease n=1 Tax=Herpetosiphon geysericola TaxID=70996 RepID=A0A0P6YDU2_9CHLR|nr:ABC transporter permease [Herpetosiphon geysericola]KPL91707.1 peptide ABC transporter permease [Herpetosiphon geysericola]
MLGYIFRRLLGIIPVLLGISLLVFTLLRTIPGDPAIIILGERSTPEQRAALRTKLKLDRPLYLNFEGGNVFESQYVTYITNFATGDFGDSIKTRQAISKELKERFPATIELALSALLIAVVVGVTTGVVSATKRGSLLDAGSMIVALLGVSIPIFWLGLMMQYLFSVKLKWLDPSLRLDTSLHGTFKPITGLYLLDGLLLGRFDITANAFKHLIMPSLALATVPLASIARMTRSAMLEVLYQDYIRTARAKGLSARITILRHGLRNALIPVITVIGLQLGFLLGGAVLTETVFSWPGIGRWLLDGILARDYPVVQSGVMFVSLVFVLINTLVDISYRFFDPRIQFK